MSNLVDTIKTIQRCTGATPDGVFGPESAAAVLRELSRVGLLNPGVILADDMDQRTVNNLMTLDPKARERFAQFCRLANATAATFGCSYVMIEGHRSWEDQDALYAIGRTKPGTRVTRAKGGQSNHNFGIAADFGVFKGKVYMDGGGGLQQEIAAKVHKACSMHAEACGLEWGGSWKSIVDQPHYEIPTGLTNMEKRSRYIREGSLL